MYLQLGLRIMPYVTHLLERFMVNKSARDYCPFGGLGEGLEVLAGGFWGGEGVMFALVGMDKQTGQAEQD